MSQNRHLGRQGPTFPVEGHPERHIAVMQNHGVLARIMRARRCPCSGDKGVPELYCDLCKGDGLIYDFQRKLLQYDEDGEVKGKRDTVEPYRVPILEPVSVVRSIAPEQGGPVKYRITGFDSFNIFIEGNPLPHNWERLLVTYFYDRYAHHSERPEVDVPSRTLTCAGPIWDGLVKTSNPKQMTGDITIVSRLYDAARDHEFKDFWFRKNQIYIGPSEPEPTPGYVEVDYFYAPAAIILAADLSARDPQEKFEGQAFSGTVKFAVETWFELGDGDLITLLMPEYARDEVFAHSGTGVDKLMEFDVERVDDVIFAASGQRYFRGSDWVKQGFRDIRWIGRQPQPGEHCSTRYLYHPTYVIMGDQPAHNTLENKEYLRDVVAKLWTKTLSREPVVSGNPVYDDFGQAMGSGVPFGR